MIKQVAKRTGFTKENATAAVNALIDALIEALYNHEEIRIKEIGVIEPVVRAGRRRYNPKTGERMFVPPYKSYRYRMSAPLKKHLKNESNT